jgi:hypothetical protein
MTSAIKPDSVIAAVWAEHEERERLAQLTRGMTGRNGDLILLRARRAIAEQKPGCAAAILSTNAATNWDRGQLVRDEVQRIRDSGEYPED